MTILAWMVLGIGMLFLGLLVADHWRPSWPVMSDRLSGETREIAAVLCIFANFVISALLALLVLWRKVMPLLVVICLAWTVPALADEIIQWAAQAYVPNVERVTFPENMIEANHPVYVGPGAGAFPFVVPADRWLLITDINFGSKHVMGRASYLIITCSCAPGSQSIVPVLLTVPSTVGALSLRTPIMIPPGSAVSAWFINNSPEDQWMNALVLGILVAAP